MTAASPGPTAASNDHAIPGTALLQRLGRTSVLAFGLQVAGVGMSYVAHLLAARLAGPESYGLYAYVTAIIVVVAYLAALGYDSAMLRFLPTYAERQEWHLVAGIVAFVERRVKAIAIAAAGLGLAVVAVTSTASSPERLLAFGLGMILIPIWALTFIRCATMRALGNVLTAQLPERVIRDGGLAALLALAALFYPFRFDAPFLVASLIVSALCALAFATHVARRLSHVGEVGSCHEDEAEPWRRAAYPFLAMVAAEALINRCGVLLLGAFGRDADAGCFALISNLACLVMLPRLAVNAFLTPMIARLYTRRDLAGLGLIVSKSSLWSFAGSLAIGAGIWVASPVLLRWYGPTFVAGHAALGVLIVGQIVAASAGAQLQLLKMTGREIAAAKVLVGSLIVHVVLGVVLIPTMGLMGAALANLGCLVTWNVSMTPIVWRHLGIRPGIVRLPARPLQEHL